MTQRALSKMLPPHRLIGHFPVLEPATNQAADRNLRTLGITPPDLAGEVAALPPDLAGEVAALPVHRGIDDGFALEEFGRDAAITMLGRFVWRLEFGSRGLVLEEIVDVADQRFDVAQLRLGRCDNPG